MPSPITDPLFEIERDIKMCVRCPLSCSRTKAVPGSGNTRASIFMIGEAPGQNEDATGEPFVGKAGHKLDEWLHEAGLTRGHIFITNVLKCQPPENKFPEDAAKDGPVDQCLPYLTEQLRIVNPLAIVIMGKQALQHVLLRGTGESASPVDRWVGQVCRRRDLFGEARVGVMYHPAYILRSKNPREEAQCVGLLRAIKNYAATKLRNEPAPLIDIHEVRPVGTPVFQQRFKLFGDSPS